MNTKFLGIVGTIPGFEVQTKQIGDISAVSITGSAKAIGYSLQFLLFVGLLTIDQIARAGIRKDGQKAHLVLIDNPQYQIGKDDENKLALLDGYDYAHQMTALGQGVNVAIFDNGFKPGAQTGKALGQMFAAMFEKLCVRGTNTNTLLLLGRSTQNRVLVASKWGKQYPFTVVNQEFSGDVHYASCRDNTILAVRYGTSQIAALHVDEIVNKFENDTVPTWQRQFVTGAEIEDMTPSIGNEATVVLTAMIDGKRQLIPANIGWSEPNKDGKREFTFTPVLSYAADMPQDKGPVVRLSSDTVTLVDSNGRDTQRLAILDINEFGDNKNVTGLRRIAKDGESGQIYRAAA